MHNLQPKHFPSDLRERPLWIWWRPELRPDGKFDKIPCDARLIASNWRDPANQLRCADALAGLPAGCGVGVVLNGDGLCGVDLDGCIGPDGTPAPWAAAIVERAATYTEISPSGTGLRLFLWGALPPGRRKRDRVEAYAEARYLTVTGNVLPGVPAIIASGEGAQRFLTWLHATYLAVEPVERDDSAAPVSLEDDVLLTRAFAARNGSKVRALFDGDTSGHGGDDSRADLALCSDLAFWTQDPAQLDRLFRRSGLYRDKWDSRRGATTYGAQTIDRALRRSVIYAPHAEQEAEPEDYGALRRRYDELHGLHTATFAVLGAPQWRAGEKLVALAALPELWAALQRGDVDEAGWTRAPLDRLAEKVGVERKAVGRALDRLAAAGVLETVTVKRFDPVTRTRKNERHLRIPATDVAASLPAWLLGMATAAPARSGSGWGGLRVMTCPECGSGSIIERVTVACADCGCVLADDVRDASTPAADPLKYHLGTTTLTTTGDKLYQDGISLRDPPPVAVPAVPSWPDLAALREVAA